MKINKLIISILLCFFSFSSLAADLQGVSKIFKQTFWTSHYEERFCGKNIEGLVRKAIAARIDLTDAEIIQITDVGGWMFGMVNALQAREGGRPIVPAQTMPTRVPGEKNWNFHVFLLVNGQVLDYDFTNQPRIVPMKTYLHEMFIPVAKYNDVKYKLSKMKIINVKRFPAEEYMIRLNARMPMKDIASESYLKDYMPSFFQ